MARINEQDIDQLRERASLVEIASAYTALKKAGPGTYKGLCPFHSERTPSFTVDEARGLFYCFGCGEGGNVYHFVQKAENLPFPEAVEWLARRVGYDLRYEGARPGEAVGRGLKQRLLEANEAAARFFARALMESEEAEPARAYLESRGFGPEVARRWMLGWAPGRNALCRHLLGRGFSEEEILKADLGRRSERDGSLYDTFRQRITFPTWDLQGAVVGFGARALGDAQPKYLNSAETPVFRKSRVMYGLNRAKASIARGAPAIVVEGYTDVIALHEAGVTEAVATNGVALGESHFEQLKKFTGRVVLMLDADSAGQAATERSFDIHHRLGVEVLVATLPAGRDPADVVRADGREGIAKVLDSAQPLLGFKLDQVLAKAPLDTPEARARAVREAARVLESHPDPIARGDYAFSVARRIGVEPEAVQRALAERQAEGGITQREADRRLPGHVKAEREALQLLLTRTRELAPWLGMVEESDFTSPARRELFREAAALARSGGSAGAGLAERLSPEAVSLLGELVVGAEEVAPEDLERRVVELFTRIKVFGLEREIRKHKQTLQQINPVEEPERHDALFTELVGLEARRRDLLRRLR